MDAAAHKAKAEYYLRVVDEYTGGYGYTFEMNQAERNKWLRMAQIHATLATMPEPQVTEPDRQAEQARAMETHLQTANLMDSRAGGMS